jgi:hypothetical protein
MLFSNLDVVFKHNSDLTSFVIQCDRVLFTLGYIGKVREDVNFELIEDYEGFREHLEIKPYLSAFETEAMKAFLKASDKKLTIEGNDYEVVNDMKNTKFTLFKGSSIAAYPTLRFKKKVLV